MSASGQSNIDVTLATQNLVANIENWRVDCCCTTSDHNLIIVKLKGHDRKNSSWISDLGYNIKRANWPKFRDQVELNFDESTIGEIATLPAEKAVEAFNSKLTMCCQTAIPKKKSSNIMVPWWTEQLTNLKKKVTLAKKQLLRDVSIRPSSQVTTQRYIEG